MAQEHRVRLQQSPSSNMKTSSFSCCFTVTEKKFINEHIFKTFGETSEMVTGLGCLLMFSLVGWWKLVVC